MAGEFKSFADRVIDEGILRNTIDFAKSPWGLSSGIFCRTKIRVLSPLERVGFGASRHYQ
jgi:hypothetical protein